MRQAILIYPSLRNAHLALWMPFALIGVGAARYKFPIVRRSNFRPSRAAADGRATTTANQRKALHQAIDADQPPVLE
jgi:hypothetical protein